jgi:hypothetical protein
MLLVRAENIILSTIFLFYHPPPEGDALIDISTLYCKYALFWNIIITIILVNPHIFVYSVVLVL